MCVNQRWIYNRFADQKILVKCGKCKSCLQEKANSIATSIRRHGSFGEVCMFITLTYTNDFIPYLDKNDYIYFSRFDDGNYYPCVKIYRNAKVKRFYNPKLQKIDEKIVYGKHVIDYLPIWDEDCFDLIRQFPSVFKSLRIKMYDILENKDIASHFHFLYDLIVNLPFFKGNDNNTIDFVSVCYFKDIQDFYKRLYQYLKRNCNYDVRKLSFFNCSEYGKCSSRAHFHSLLWCPVSDYFLIKRAIIACWPYCNSYQRCNKLVSRAKSPARYVAGYVTKHTSLPNFFTLNSFKQRHSTSKNFRWTFAPFQQKEVFKSFKRGNLVFDCRIIRKGGNVDVVTLPLPKFVIDRYFPKCSGFSRFTRDEMEKYIQKPFSLFVDLRNNNNHLFDRLKHIFYSDDNYVCYRSILKFYKKFIAYAVKVKKLAFSIGLPISDVRVYISYIYDVWTKYYSFQLRRLHESCSVIQDYFNGFYNNILDYFTGDIISPFLDSLIPFCNEFTSNPNHFPRCVNDSYVLEKQYYEADFLKGVSDYFLENDTLNNYEFTKQTC